MQLHYTYVNKYKSKPLGKFLMHSTANINSFGMMNDHASLHLNLTNKTYYYLAKQG